MAREDRRRRHRTPDLRLAKDSAHDKLFHEAFENPRDAAALLANVLPKSLSAKIDFSTLTPVPGRFVDGRLTRSWSDLLFSVRIAGVDARLYVLFEHKSRGDRWTPLQLHRYMARIWERCLKATPRLRYLPPIVPIVVYHGPHGWRAGTQFSDLFDPDALRIPELRAFVPDFQFLVDDVSHLTDAELRRRNLSAFALLSLLLLRDARTRGRLLAGLERWVDLFRQIGRLPDAERARSILFHYIAVVTQHLDFATIRRAVHDALPEAEETIMTIAEQLRREGEQKGLEKGLQKGLEKGLQEGFEKGRREALRELLQAKFKRVDEEHRALLESADAAALRRYGERILRAASIEEVFEE